jgi:hypothetical protein
MLETCIQKNSKEEEEIMLHSISIKWYMPVVPHAVLDYERTNGLRFLPN